MPNSYFQFKQFRIDQDHTAMKVCTDACIQGAYTARLWKKDLPASSNILDLGTGTGLLSLMLAQELDASVEAVELDPASCIQARENIAQSPWATRIQVLEGDLRTLPLIGPYDGIISNPPFYEDSLKSPSEAINQARHSSRLCHDHLLQRMEELLSPEGQVSVLLPAAQRDRFVQKAQRLGFRLRQVLSLRQTDRHPFFRVILVLDRSATHVLEEELTLQDKQGYTPACAALMQPYYLKL